MLVRYANALFPLIVCISFFTQLVKSLIKLLLSIGYVYYNRPKKLTKN